MNIAICEDITEDAQRLKYILQEYQNQNDMPMKIDVFDKGEELIDRCRDESYDIIFMDIYLTNMSGIEAARHIRESQKCHVAFLTASSDFALEAIELDALHYIVKPAEYSDVEEIMLRLRHRIPAARYAPLQVKAGYRTVYIDPLSIRYIESYDKISVVHTDTLDYETYSTLSSLSSLLDKGLFMRPQRSYIVNMSYIASMSSDELVLADGTRITLSRAGRGRLKKTYENFLFTQIREGAREVKYMGAQRRP